MYPLQHTCTYEVGREVGGIRNQASEIYRFLGIGGPCIFLIFFLFLIFDFFFRMITIGGIGRGKGKG